MNGRSRFGLYVGRIFGIRFYLDYSWFFIAAILTYDLAANAFPVYLPGHPQLAYIAMGAIASLVFFISILLHELGHSLVSQRCGIPVPRITLLFIGGIAEISREPDTARAELKIALGGPAVSIALALLYGLGALAAAPLGWMEAATVLKWLAMVNILLVVFNAIPGYPLDGGRVLRALLWARMGNLRKATFITTRIGVAFSWVLIGIGAICLWAGLWNALVFFLIGIFLKNAAESGYANTLSHEVLAGVRVADIMTHPPICIPDHTPLSLAVDDFFLAKNHSAFPVIGDNGEFRGLLRLEHLKEVPREKWAFVRAGEIAAATTEPAAVQVLESAERTLRRLLGAGQGRLVVLEGEKVVGIVTRHDILHFIKIHTELT